MTKFKSATLANFKHILHIRATLHGDPKTHTTLTLNAHAPPQHGAVAIALTAKPATTSIAFVLLINNTDIQFIEVHSNK